MKPHLILALYLSLGYSVQFGFSTGARAHIFFVHEIPVHYNLDSERRFLNICCECEKVTAFGTRIALQYSRLIWKKQ